MGVIKRKSKLYDLLLPTFYMQWASFFFPKPTHYKVTHMRPRQDAFDSTKIVRDDRRLLTSKKNKTHFVEVVHLFIIFLKLKADCFIECTQHQTELMGPLLALFLRNFGSLVSLVSVTTLLLLGYSCTFSIINEYYLWHWSVFMYWKLNGHHVAIMLHLQPVVPVFHLPAKSISDFSNNP